MKWNKSKNKRAVKITYFIRAYWQILIRTVEALNPTRRWHKFAFSNSLSYLCFCVCFWFLLPPSGQKLLNAALIQSVCGNVTIKSQREKKTQASDVQPIYLQKSHHLLTIRSNCDAPTQCTAATRLFIYFTVTCPLWIQGWVVCLNTWIRERHREKTEREREKEREREREREVIRI